MAKKLNPLVIAGVGGLALGGALLLYALRSKGWNPFAQSLNLVPGLNYIGAYDPQVIGTTYIGPIPEGWDTNGVVSLCSHPEITYAAYCSKDVCPAWEVNLYCATGMGGNFPIKTGQPGWILINLESTQPKSITPSMVL